MGQGQWQNVLEPEATLKLIRKCPVLTWGLFFTQMKMVLKHTDEAHGRPTINSYKSLGQEDLRIQQNTPGFLLLPHKIIRMLHNFFNSDSVCHHAAHRECFLEDLPLARSTFKSWVTFPSLKTIGSLISVVEGCQGDPCVLGLLLHSWGTLLLPSRRRSTVSGVSSPVDWMGLLTHRLSSRVLLNNGFYF